MNLHTLRLAAIFFFSTFSTLSFAQTGASLPAGYFHVVGNQIVSSTGTNVRLSCIGYDEATGNYVGDMAKIRAAGFNCVRRSWYDATTCPKGKCSFSAQDAVVNAASVNGIRVIWSHHGNEGVNGPSGNKDCGSQQENGLWYDLNSTQIIAGVQWNALTG